MSTQFGSLFCDTLLARRIEMAEVDLVRAANAAARRRQATGFLVPVAGGVASFADNGSPFNKVTGLGFAGVPEPEALDSIERAFAARGAPTQIERPISGIPPSVSRSPSGDTGSSPSRTSWAARWTRRSRRRRQSSTSGDPGTT